MRQIPTQQAWTLPKEEHQYSFINHGRDGKSIFIIELNEKGNKACIQYNGTSCSHADVRGFIFKEFKSKSKWFRPSWWYKKTAWGNYGPGVYFNEARKDDDVNIYPSLFIDLPIGEERNKRVQEEMDIFFNRNKELAQKYSLRAEYILERITSAVYLGTGIGFAVDFDNANYGTNWAEAYIPLTYKGKKYLLTWQNCD